MSLQHVDHYLPNAAAAIGALVAASHEYEMQAQFLEAAALASEPPRWSKMRLIGRGKPEVGECLSRSAGALQSTAGRVQEAARQHVGVL